MKYLFLYKYSIAILIIKKKIFSIDVTHGSLCPLTYTKKKKKRKKKIKCKKPKSVLGNNITTNKKLNWIVTFWMHPVFLTRWTNNQNVYFCYLCIRWTLGRFETSWFNLISHFDNFHFHLCVHVSVFVIVFTAYQTVNIHQLSSLQSSTL